MKTVFLSVSMFMFFCLTIKQKFFFKKEKRTFLINGNSSKSTSGKKGLKLNGKYSLCSLSGPAQ